MLQTFLALEMILSPSEHYGFTIGGIEEVT